MIKITVVTITFQAENVLERTVDSVLSQNYPHVQHLIIDGASKDNTLSIAFAYKHRSDAVQNGHEVIILSEPDKGIYDAMQKGIDMARGTYLVFLNAGDCFHDNDTLSYVAHQAEQKGTLPAVIYGDTDVVDETGSFLYHRRLSPPENLNWHSFRWGMLVCHQAFYALTSIAKTVPYNQCYRFSADVDWCIRVMKEAERQQLPLVNAHEVLVNYLEEGQTTLHHRESLKERFHIMKNHYGLLTTIVMHLWFIIRSVWK